MKKIIFLISIIYAANSYCITTDKVKVIVSENSNTAELTLKSSSEDSYNLVKTQIQNKCGDLSENFIITPPLVQTFPGSETVLRIFSVNVKNLPQNKESRQTIIINSTPALKKSEQQNESNANLKYHINKKIKMYLVFRPSGISTNKSPEILSKRVTLEALANKIRVTNNSPFFIDVTNINVKKTPLFKGGKILLSLKPFSSGTLNASMPKREKAFLTIIDDFGASETLPAITAQ
ncbi:molecular chaperone [Klebsiella pneumoniae]|nr:molecular chaperone [Klebsiella pneumoniae]